MKNKMKIAIFAAASAVIAAIPIALLRRGDPQWLADMRESWDLNLSWGAVWQVADERGRMASGQGFCSKTGGTYAEAGRPVRLFGAYCWCRMTSPAIGAWVFQHSYESDADCHSLCAMNCADHISRVQAVRAAVLMPLP